jgi:hypothetical protein
LRYPFQSLGNPIFIYFRSTISPTFFYHARPSTISVISESPFLTFRPCEIITKPQDSMTRSLYHSGHGVFRRSTGRNVISGNFRRLVMKRWIWRGLDQNDSHLG